MLGVRKLTARGARRWMSGNAAQKNKKVVFDPWHSYTSDSPHDNCVGVYAGGDNLNRRLVMARPKALNALNEKMVDYMTPRLKLWENEEDCLTVSLMGVGGKAFCAGGDIVDMWKRGKEATFNKPLVAYVDGITMGGGVGISVHGRYRVATDATVFAMPETGIGFFPDVGGSYFLPRLKGELGMFLALTGHRLTGPDVYHAGIATHFVDRSLLATMQEQLAAITRVHEKEAITNVINKYHDNRLEPFSLAPHMDDIQECFSGDSVEEIIESLKAHGTEWSESVLKKLDRVSPTSLKVTFRQIREGATLPLEDCFKMEYRIASRFMKGGNTDFHEGVRALLIDKCGKPQWEHATVEDVSDEYVSEYFSAEEGNPDLLLGYLAEPVAVTNSAEKTTLEALKEEDESKLAQDEREEKAEREAHSRLVLQRYVGRNDWIDSQHSDDVEISSRVEDIYEDLELRNRVENFVRVGDELGFERPIGLERDESLEELTNVTKVDYGRTGQKSTAPPRRTGRFSKHKKPILKEEQ